MPSRIRRARTTNASACLGGHRSRTVSSNSSTQRSKCPAARPPIERCRSTGRPGVTARPQQGRRPEVGHPRQVSVPLVHVRLEHRPEPVVAARPAVELHDHVADQRPR